VIVAPRAGELVNRLDLQPHPEGGFFREIFRSIGQVTPDDDRGPRASLTTIYFLLAAGQHSRWHRVRSDEVWHFYEGDALELLLMDPGMSRIRAVTLGPTEPAERVAVAPAGWWQAARPLGAYALTGCTVAPGFEFADFDFLADLGPLRRLRPDLAALA
jgi:predicted cupin superfamily sugar epimerase